MGVGWTLPLPHKLSGCGPEGRGPKDSSLPALRAQVCPPPHISFSSPRKSLWPQSLLPSPTPKTEGLVAWRLTLGEAGSKGPIPAALHALSVNLVMPGMFSSSVMPMGAPREIVTVGHRVTSCRPHCLEVCVYSKAWIPRQGRAEGVCEAPAMLGILPFQRSLGLLIASLS